MCASIAYGVWWPVRHRRTHARGQPLGEQSAQIVNSGPPVWVWSATANRADMADIGLQAVNESAIRPQAAGQQASRAPGRLNWPQDRERPDPRSASGAGLTQARARPLPWPHELPDPGISHQFSSSSADSGKSHRYGGSSPPGRKNPQPQPDDRPPPPRTPRARRSLNTRVIFVAYWLA